MAESPQDIVVKNLTKAYGSFVAVDQISFEVAKGSIVGFLGPNGAGKSTTLRVLTCSMPPTAGSAKVAGLDVFSQSLQVREKIGYLPESNPLYTEMRVEEYLDYRGRLRNLDRATRKKRMGEVIEKCWLKGRERSLISTLSKGFRQRVGIADALLHNPAVVILDEPTVGLDPTQIREARTFIKSLGGAHTVLFSTHIMSEVEAVCQRVIIIARGKIVAQGSTAELRTRGGQGIRVEVRGPSEQIKSALNALPNVDSVDVISPGDVCTLIIRGKISGELREQIAATCAQRSWGLRELRTEGATLEEYFIQITDPAGAAKNAA